MKLSKRPYLSSCLFLTVMSCPLATSCFAQTAAPPVAQSRVIKKKLIGLAMQPPDAATVRQNLAQIEAQTPFNGIAIAVTGTDDKGAEVQVCNVFSRAPWKRAWFQKSIEDLKAIRASRKTLTDNFVLVRTNPGLADWFDDLAWKQVIEHWRIAAYIAREGGAKGLMFDPENYSHLPQFNYEAQLGRKEMDLHESVRDPLRLARAKDPAKMPTFEQFQAKARQRGQELIQALATEFPDLTIYTLWMNSLNLMSSDTANPQAALRVAPSGLYPAFIDGWLDKATPQMTFVDGCEWAYGYDSPIDFLQSANEMRSTVLNLVAPENRSKYGAQVQTSFGLYLDPYVNPPGTLHYLDPKGVTPTERIRMRTDWALKAASEYVWIYGEQYKWWPATYTGVKPDYWNDKLPGITPALRSTTQPGGKADYLLSQLKEQGKATNLFRNGDFSEQGEQQSAGQLAAPDWKSEKGLPGWGNWMTETSKGTFSRDANVTHSGGAGSGSGRISNMESGCLTQVAAVKPGETYLLRAWTRTNSTNPGYIRIRWKSPDQTRWVQEGRDMLIMAPPAAKGEWSQFSGLITVPPDAGNLIMLMIAENQKPEDSVWFDDAELYKTSD